MKILVVKYLPSGDNSNTLKLYNHFKEVSKSVEIEEIDLISNKIPIFKPETIEAYGKSNMGVKNSKSELLMVPFKALTNKVKTADAIVFVHPMHNFSLPGIVKQFMDAIILNGETFAYGSPTKGLLEDKKVAVLYTSGGSYPQDSDYAYLDNVKTLYNILFDFIDLKDRVFIHAATANPDLLTESIQNAKVEVDSLVKRWNL